MNGLANYRHTDPLKIQTTIFWEIWCSQIPVNNQQFGSSMYGKFTYIYH